MDTEIQIALSSLHLIIAKSMQPSAEREYLDYFSLMNNVVPDLKRLQLYTRTEARTLASGLQLDKYEKGDEIGRGATGVVYRGRDRTTGNVVAIKCFKRRYKDNNHDSWRESKLLYSLSHVSKLFHFVLRPSANKTSGPCHKVP